MPSLSRRAFLSHTCRLTLGVTLLAGCGGAPSANPPASRAASTAGAGASPAAASAVAQATPRTAGASPAATATASRPAATAATAATGVVLPPTPSGEANAHLAIARGNSPEAITRAAIKALGGMERFVKPGQRVLVKPNICTAQPPEYAATTNPEVVATIVSLCREAKAGRVLVVDNPFSGFNSAYQRSGIEAAVKAAGGEIETMSRLKFRRVDIPRGRDIKSWSIYEDALKFDVVINVPIAKHHNLATLTLGMKNLMGLIDNPGAFHSNIGQRLADLATVVQPQLIVVDAVRILTRNGPTGGDLRDVKQLNTVVASVDPVAADACAATFFGMKGEALAYVRAGVEMGLGEKDLSKLRLAELSL